MDPRLRGDDDMRFPNWLVQRPVSAGIGLALLATSPAYAQDADVQKTVEAKLAGAPAGTRFGLVVTDDAGHELVAVNPEQRFMPASNTKIFTTAAVFWTMAGLDAPDATGGASVRLDGKDVVLEGHGDARLSGAADCKSDCLATLADAVAAMTHKVRDVIGDDTAFPDQRWSAGMSWNNISTRSGTGISALTIDDNELWLFARPGALGTAPGVDGPAYYTLDNRAVTVPGAAGDLSFARDPNGMTLRLTGTIGVDAKPERLRLGIDDPAHYAAWQLANLLRARGVKVKGQVRALHRPTLPSDDPEIRKDAPPVHPEAHPELATLTPEPLYADLMLTNKVSQNLHAELFLRRIGLEKGTGSVADGLAVVRAMLAAAGVPRANYDFSDGSGMSTYNRVSPRGVTLFLRWIAAQPWGTQWRATLPTTGEGTLARRFKGGALDGRLFAKTGSLSATNGLSGYMVAKSGRTLTFSAYANDVPDGADALPALDAALEAVAEAE